MAAQPVRRGMLFEEFRVGQQIATRGRTITEVDVVSFAGLTGDYNQIHTDAQFAETTRFGQRIAHGLLVLSAVLGLVVQTGILDGTIIAFREINNWKFSKPVFFGDTVHGVLEVAGTKALPRLGGGAIVINLKVVNQHDDTVMTGDLTILMASAPEQ